MSCKTVTFKENGKYYGIKTEDFLRVYLRTGEVSEGEKRYIRRKLTFSIVNVFCPTLHRLVKLYYLGKPTRPTVQQDINCVFGQGNPPLYYERSIEEKTVKLEREVLKPWCVIGKTYKEADMFAQERGKVITADLMSIW